jgi:DNA-binding response OmpR family regulator
VFTTHRRTIVAVDDDPDIRELVCLSLRTTGHQVLGADCGRAALDLLDTHAVDLLVLDVMMPGMSGLEVARRVRGVTDDGPPILMVSALGSDRDVAAAMAAGADDYLPKPFGVRELLDRVVTLLAQG